MSKRTAKTVGAIGGILISTFFFVYLPMIRNYTQCQRVYTMQISQPDEQEEGK